MGWIVLLMWFLGMAAHWKAFRATEFPQDMPKVAQDVALIIAALFWPVVMFVAVLLLIHTSLDARVTKWRKS